MTREEVIRGLECCISGNPAICKRVGCPYAEEHYGIGDTCIDHLMADALALLKAQEQKPISASIVDSDGGLMHWWACGNCQAPINPEDIFCHECGRKVNWE